MLKKLSYIFVFAVVSLILMAIVLIMILSDQPVQAMLLGFALISASLSLILFYGKIKSFEQEKVEIKQNSEQQIKTLTAQYDLEIKSLSSDRANERLLGQDSVSPDTQNKIYAENEYIKHNLYILTNLLQALSDKSMADTETLINKINAVSDHTLEFCSQNVESLRNVIGFSESKGGKSFKHIEESTQRLQGVNDVLDRMISSGKSEEKYLIHVETKIKEIKEFTQKIENIAESTNVLSFNASIEAAKSGHSSKGFSIIAREIKKLATEAKASVATIHGIASEAVDAVHNLKIEYDGIMSKLNEHIKVSKFELQEILSIVSDSYQKIADRVIVLTDNTTKYNEKLEALMLKYLQYQDIISQQIAHIQVILATLNSKAEKVNQDIRADIPAQQIQDIKKQVILDIINHLTMDHERDCVRKIADDFKVDLPGLKPDALKQADISTDRAKQLIGVEDDSVILF